MVVGCMKRLPVERYMNYREKGIKTITTTITKMTKTTTTTWNKYLILCVCLNRASSYVLNEWDKCKRKDSDRDVESVRGRK